MDQVQSVYTLTYTLVHLVCRWQAISGVFRLTMKAIKCYTVGVRNARTG